MDEGKMRKLISSELSLLVLESLQQLEAMEGKIFSKSQVAKLFNTILL